MIKKILHKSFSVALALTVLMSTMSFTIQKHYCGSILVDTAVFSSAEKCGMAMSKSEATKMKKMNCCKDEVKVVKGQDDLKVNTFEDIQFQQQQFLTTFIFTYINLFEGLPQQVIPHKDYSPPNLVADIQVLDQVFII
ncbi:HYC_CC_PP family protein [Litoribaculum gwangyangense]|uniref:Secreted protein n=1 Tax=Litoribaculum gwangyangense TaxID=1130722 RepID=A0ABP9CRB0_9FLAO